MALTEDQARAIITQARADESYEGPIPDDAKKMISEAESLVEMASAAWAANVRGPEVEAILRLAENGASANGGSPAAEAEVEDSPTNTESTRTEAETSEPSGEDLTKVEPWEGYDSEKMVDIIADIDWLVDNDGDAGAALAHVWEYETANKDRKGIIKKLEDLAAGGGDGDGKAEEKPPATKARADAPASAPADSSGAQGGEGGEGDGEEAEGDGDADADASADERREAPQPRAQRPVPQAEASPEAVADVPDDADAEYLGVIDAIQKRVDSERLHVPGMIEVEPPEVPFDWTTITDKGLQMLYGAFAAYAYRVGYLEKLEESYARVCRQAATELTEALIAHSDKIDVQTEKPKTMTVLEAEIAQDPNVKKWRKRQYKHETFAASYKSDREGYNKMLEALSRLGTLRQDEWERAGGKSGRR